MACLHNPSLLLSLLDVPHQLFREKTVASILVELRMDIKPYLVYFRSVKKFPIDDCKLLRLLSYLTLPRRRAVIGVPLLRQVQTCLLHKIFSAHSLAIHFEVSHSLGRATAFCTPPSWCEPSRDKIWQGRTFIGANFIATFCPRIIFRRRTIFFVTRPSWRSTAAIGP